MYSSLLSDKWKYQGNTNGFTVYRWMWTFLTKKNLKEENKLLDYSEKKMRNEWIQIIRSKKKWGKPINSYFNQDTIFRSEGWFSVMNQLMIKSFCPIKVASFAKLFQLFSFIIIRDHQ